MICVVIPYIGFVFDLTVFVPEMQLFQDAILGLFVWKHEIIPVASQADFFSHEPRPQFSTLAPRLDEMDTFHDCLLPLLRCECWP